MGELALIPVIISGATGGAVVTSLTVNGGIGLWQRFRRWLRYFRCVIRLISKETDPALFIELITRISPHCVDLKSAIHVSLSFQNSANERPIARPYLLPKPGEYLPIIIGGIKLNVLVVSLNGIDAVGFEFSCKRNRRRVMDNFIGSAMSAVGISVEDIQRIYPAFISTREAAESKNESDTLLRNSISRNNIELRNRTRH